MARPDRRTTDASRPRRTAAAAVLACVVLGMGASAACSRDPERSPAAYCAQIKNVQNLNDIVASGDVTAIGQQLDQLRALDQAAPPEIEPKVALLIGFFDDYAKTVRTAKTPDAALEEVARARGAGQDAVNQAGVDVNRYTLDTCHIDLSGTTGPGTTPGTTGTTPGSTAPR